jgi:hypothetical protein
VGESPAFLTAVSAHTVATMPGDYLRSTIDPLNVFMNLQHAGAEGRWVLTVIEK